MKKHILISGLIAIASGLFATAADAACIPKLADFFGQKINRVEAAMNAAESGPADSQAKKPIVLEDINLDLIPTASFGISEVLDLTLTPEIDFVVVLNEPASGTDPGPNP